MKTLSVFINDQLVYEYDKDKSFDDRQQAFLDKMDSDMNRGLKIQGELITTPDSQQRAKFVAMILIKALQQEKDAIISASCAYLVNRQPSLIEIRVNDHENTVNIELIQAQN
jgi:hypothetical protein